eukprot:scaffold129781_cov33-Tisochrysis_lutea.AAC.3
MKSRKRAHTTTPVALHANTASLAVALFIEFNVSGCPNHAARVLVRLTSGADMLEACRLRVGQTLLASQETQLGPHRVAAIAFAHQLILYRLRGN